MTESNILFDDPEAITQKLDAGFIPVSRAYMIVHGNKSRPSTDQYKPWAEQVMNSEKIRVLTITGLKNRCPYFYADDVQELKRKRDEEIAAKAAKLPDLFEKITAKSFYTVKDICSLLQVSESVVYKAIREQRLKSIHFEGCIRITKQALDDYLYKPEPAQTADKPYGFDANGEKVVF